MNYNNDSQRWQYWGRWNQVMLFTANWLDFKNTTVFQKMGLSHLRGETKILLGYYYFLNQDLGALCKTLEGKLRNNSPWFKKYFDFCNTNTEKLLSFEHKKDLKKFIQFFVDFSGCSILVEFLDFCLEKYLKKICGEKGIALGEVLAQIKPAKQTELNFGN